MLVASVLRRCARIICTYLDFQDSTRWCKQEILIARAMESQGSAFSSHNVDRVLGVFRAGLETKSNRLNKVIARDHPIQLLLVRD